MCLEINLLVTPSNSAVDKNFQNLLESFNTCIYVFQFNQIPEKSIFKCILLKTILNFLYTGVDSYICTALSTL